MVWFDRLNGDRMAKQFPSIFIQFCTRILEHLWAMRTPHYTLHFQRCEVEPVTIGYFTPIENKYPPSRLVVPMHIWSVLLESSSFQKSRFWSVVYFGFGLVYVNLHFVWLYLKTISCRWPDWSPSSRGKASASRIIL
jgi:hypothetical protein